LQPNRINNSKQCDKYQCQFHFESWQKLRTRNESCFYPDDSRRLNEQDKMWAVIYSDAIRALCYYKAIKLNLPLPFLHVRHTPLRRKYSPRQFEIN
jgi:hypothetical protein